jgi:uracil-DNA glycosylase
MSEQPPLAPIDVKLEESWKEALQEEFLKPYFHSLIAFIKEEKKANKLIYPPGSLIFKAFELTSFTRVKVVILGQDPYINPGQAHGLCFSVPFGMQPPPSLLNIYKELESDLGIQPPKHGNLEKWAKQGVFLLNAILTVEAARSGSHQGKGWEEFTSAVIQKLNILRSNIVFLLWGNYAQEKGKWIDTQKHLVLKAAHPSPLSAYKGFLGCKHFSKTNAYLKQNGLEPIDWSL